MTDNYYVRLVYNWRITYVNRPKPSNFATIYMGLRKSPHKLAVI